jgi:hypothetical protein
MPTRIAPETTTMKNDAPITHGIDVKPLSDPSELSSTTSTYDGLSDAIFEGIDDGMDDDDGNNDTDEGTLEDAVSIEKLSSFITRPCPNHSISLTDTKK